MLEVAIVRVPTENMVNFPKLNSNISCAYLMFTIFIFLEYELNESRNEYDESDISSEGNMNLDDEEADDVHSLNGPQYTFKEEETKSRFTEYSISSSVMRRNKQLTLLDDKFEQV